MPFQLGALSWREGDMSTAFARTGHDLDTASGMERACPDRTRVPVSSEDGGRLSSALSDEPVNVFGIYRLLWMGAVVGHCEQTGEM